MPVAYLAVLCQKIQKFSDERFVARWGAMFDEIRIRSDIFYKAHLFCGFIFIARRMIFVLIVFLLVDHGLLQAILVVYLNIFVLVYKGWHQPFYSRKVNYIEIFNDFMVMMATDHILFFTDVVGDQESKHLMGWSMCIAISIKLLIHSIMILYDIFLYFNLLRSSYYIRGMN